MVEEINKKGGVFQYPEVFRYDNASEFKSDMTRVLEKQDVDI